MNGIEWIIMDYGCVPHAYIILVYKILNSMDTLQVTCPYVQISFPVRDFHTTWKHDLAIRKQNF
jgi:hypothetical protein